MPNNLLTQCDFIPISMVCVKNLEDSLHKQTYSQRAVGWDKRTFFGQHFNDKCRFRIMVGKYNTLYSLIARIHYTH